MYICTVHGAGCKHHRNLFFPIKESRWKSNWRKEGSGREIESVQHEVVDGTKPIVDYGLSPGVHEVGEGLHGVHGHVTDLHCGAADLLGRLNSHTPGRVHRGVQHAHEATAGCRHAVA